MSSQKFLKAELVLTKSSWDSVMVSRKYLLRIKMTRRWSFQSLAIVDIDAVKRVRTSSEKVSVNHHFKARSYSVSYIPRIVLDEIVFAIYIN